jgi:tetratricopeptide (TPR) repeat protein
MSSQTDTITISKMTKLALSLVILFFLQSLAYGQEDQWKAWEVEADTLMDHQDFEGAIKLYSKVVTESKLSSKENFRSLYKRALSFYSLGEFDKALKDISLFIPKYPENYQAHVLSGLIYRQLGETDKQLVELNRAIELQPENLNLIKWRGTTLSEKGEYTLAKKDLLQVKGSQDDPELETNLGLIYFSLEQPDSALICINKSIELDATYEPAYLYGGSFCLEVERFDLAIKYLNLALLLDPENVNALYYKGVALIEQKKTDEGCRYLNKAFKAGQDDAAGYLKEYCYDVFK